ncbi:hypothetical protein EXN66_Car009628 [Channa argus]|uniref:Uncharacterized protein n=1 Tax=Channa argus TaxID=215402 RepID=A0A6G1PUL0_CHAAH|nr:hypothetical protein EXN66_Car009628 [Channa argus]
MYKAAISERLSSFLYLYTRRACFWIARKTLPDLLTTLRVVTEITHQNNSAENFIIGYIAGIK